jgi:hypothetical protein
MAILTFINKVDWPTLTKLPYWLAKPASELEKLRKGAVLYWQRFADILAWPAAQLDPMTAELELVHLLAWERDIEQIPQETETMYRTRVRFALLFAKGAGSKAGWLDMFEKLGMPWVTIDERFSSLDWDVINLQLLDADLSERQNLIGYLTRKYGRTTRRYQYDTIATMPLVSPPSEFSFENLTGVARLNDNISPKLGLALMDNESSFVIATNQ